MRTWITQLLVPQDHKTPISDLFGGHFWKFLTYLCQITSIFVQKALILAQKWPKFHKSSARSPGIPRRSGGSRGMEEAPFS